MRDLEDRSVGLCPAGFGNYIFKTEQTIQLFSELVGTREIKVGKIENALRFDRQYSIEMQPYLKRTFFPLNTST